MLVEVVLEPFVGEVYAKLLEAVVLIVLKAKDVQDSYGENLVEKKRQRQNETSVINVLWQHCKHQ